MSRALAFCPIVVLAALVQSRSTLDYLIEAAVAARDRGPAPSLAPP